MPRQKRVEYDGAMYHVMSRGNRGEAIFLDDVDRLMGEHGLGADPALQRQEFERRMEGLRLAAADPAGLQVLRRGWCLGGGEFKRQMLAAMEGKLGESHSGEWRRESAEAKAERIVAEELKRLGWNESDWPARRKSDPGKLGMKGS